MNDENKSIENYKKTLCSNIKEAKKLIKKYLKKYPGNNPELEEKCKMFISYVEPFLKLVNSGDFDADI